MEQEDKKDKPLFMSPGGSDSNKENLNRTTEDDQDCKIRNEGLFRNAAIMPGTDLKYLNINGGEATLQEPLSETHLTKNGNTEPLQIMDVENTDVQRKNRAAASELTEMTLCEKKENAVTQSNAQCDPKNKFQWRQTPADDLVTEVNSSLEMSSEDSLTADDTNQHQGGVVSASQVNGKQLKQPQLWGSTAALTELGDLHFDETRDDGSQIISRHSVPDIYGRSQNIFHALTNATIGRMTQNNEESISTRIASRMGRFEIVDSHRPFNMGFTTLDWHPHERNILAACTKSGDVAVYSAQQQDNSTLEKVMTHEGGIYTECITDFKYHPTADHLFFITSKFAGLSLKDMLGLTYKPISWSGHFDKFFSALEVHPAGDIVLRGWSDGVVKFMSTFGERIWSKHLHRRRITSMFFSPQDSSKLCTASFDGTVRLWDIRMLLDKRPLDTLLHRTPVSAAYFSSTDGGRLLTTDVAEEIRVFKGPSWGLESHIQHPRQRLHFDSPIKASWHPHRDVILCGRWRDPHRNAGMLVCNQFMGDDIYDAATGHWIAETRDILGSSIPSLNKVSWDGNKLAVTMGNIITLWNSEHSLDDREPSGSRTRASVKRRNLVTESQNLSDEEIDEGEQFLSPMEIRMLEEMFRIKMNSMTGAGAIGDGGLYARHPHPGARSDEGWEEADYAAAASISNDIRTMARAADTESQDSGATSVANPRHEPTTSSSAQMTERASKELAVAKWIASIRDDHETVEAAPQLADSEGASHGEEREATKEEDMDLS